MGVPIVITLLCCTYYAFASEHSHIIPVENYETKLQYLGQHVEYPETPVKIVKITKTVAVKIPVPYPVKVVEKVPYPVHINKPYPVPVPQIIKVPHPVSQHHGHEAIGAQGKSHDEQQLGGQHGNSYQVQEIHALEEAPNRDSYEPETQTYNEENYENSQNYGPNEGFHSQSSPGSSYDAPAQTYYGNNPDADSFESQSYDQAIKEYFNKMNSNGNNGHSAYNNYH